MNETHLLNWVWNNCKFLGYKKTELEKPGKEKILKNTGLWSWKDGPVFKNAYSS